jgi:hypothetical protein
LASLFENLLSLHLNAKQIQRRCARVVAAACLCLTDPATTVETVALASGHVFAASDLTRMLAIVRQRLAPTAALARPTSATFLRALAPAVRAACPAAALKPGLLASAGLRYDSVAFRVRPWRWPSLAQPGAGLTPRIGAGLDGRAGCRPGGAGSRAGRTGPGAGRPGPAPAPVCGLRPGARGLPCGLSGRVGVTLCLCVWVCVCCVRACR